MKTNIIYGVVNISDSARIAVKNELKAVGYEIVDDSIVREIKTGIDQAVSSYASQEQLVLILSHCLEPRNPFTFNDLLRYQKEVPNVKIVLVVDNDMKGSELLKDMSDNGMYLAMYGRETSATSIRDLIVTGRTVEEAKRYYGVNGMKAVSKQITIEGAVSHMTQPVKNGKEYIERIRWVRGALPSEDAFVACVQRLPDEIKDVLARDKTYYPYVEDYVLSKSGTGIHADEGKKGLLDRFRKDKKEDRTKTGYAGAEIQEAPGRKGKAQAEAGKEEKRDVLQTETEIQVQGKQGYGEREKHPAPEAAATERRKLEEAEKEKLRREEEEREKVRREKIRIEAEAKEKAEAERKQRETERKQQEAERRRQEAERRSAERAAARAAQEAAKEEAFISSGYVKEAVRSAIRRTVIGVAGGQRHIGCTHQSLLIAHYLSGMGFRVAVVEDYNQADKVFNIVAKENGKETGEMFTLSGVDYYPCFSLKQLPSLNVKNYNFVVVDFGMYDDDMIEEYGRCSLQVLVSGSRVWETGQLGKVFGSVSEEQLKTYSYLFLGTPEGKKSSIRKDMLPLRNVFFGEYAPDPYASGGYQALKEILDDFIVPDVDAGNPAGRKGGLLGRMRGLLNV